MPHQPGTFKISGYMLAPILTMFDTTTAILFIPLAVIGIAHQDGWMAPFITIPAALYIVYVVVWLGSVFPGKTLIEYLPLALGKIPGKFVAFTYVLFFIIVGSTVIREAFALLYGAAIFEHTPNLIVGLFIITATTYAVSSGLEAISRTIWYFWVFIFIAYTCFLLATLPFMEFNALLPVGETGWKTILKSTLIPHAYRGELVFLVMLLPYVKSKKDALLGSYWSIAMIVFFIAFTLIASICTLGVGTASRAYYSAFFIADFIPTAGLKIVLVVIWIVSFWGKIALGQFFITTSISQLIGLKDHRPLVTSVGLMMLIFSQVFYKTTVDMFTSVPEAFPGLALVFEYLIPGLVALVVWSRIKLGYRPPEREQSGSQSISQ